MISLGLYTLALGTIGVGVASYSLLRRKPKPPNEVELERRTWLNTVGRITDGTVIERPGNHDCRGPPGHHADLPVRRGWRFL